MCYNYDIVRVSREGKLSDELCEGVWKIKWIYYYRMLIFVDFGVGVLKLVDFVF